MAVTGKRLIYYNGMNARCTTDETIGVSCTNEMYSNSRLWRVSKNKVQRQIRKILIRLSQLKEIEKHLDLARPKLYSSSVNNMTLPFYSIDSDTTFRQRKNKHRHHHANQTKIYDLDPNKFQQANMTRQEQRRRYEQRYHNLLSDTCYCAQTEGSLSPKELAAIEKQHLKEERLKRKERKKRKKLQKDKECFSEKMICFSHDNDHWRTAPLWDKGPFCACINSNNNSYACLRTINATHNFLYCEFVNGFIKFYNLRIDPFQLWNRAFLLSEHEKNWLHSSLLILQDCKGSTQCHLGNHNNNLTQSTSSQHNGNESCTNCENRRRVKVPKTLLS